MDALCKPNELITFRAIPNMVKYEQNGDVKPCIYSCALLHSYLGLFLDRPHLFDLYCIGEHFTQIINLIKLYFVTILFYRKPKTTTEYNAKHNAEEGGRAEDRLK